jgi:Family of unknown function (DUF5709)
MTTRSDAVERAHHDYDVDEDDRLEDQIPREDSLVDRGVEDLLDEGYSPPERPYGPAVTARERYHGETLHDLLAEEEPDPAMQFADKRDDDPEGDFLDDTEIGGRRAGRLVSPNDGGDDDEPELVALDVGIDGGAACAEEAAVHLIDDEYG